MPGRQSQTVGCETGRAAVFCPAGALALPEAGVEGLADEDVEEPEEQAASSNRATRTASGAAVRVRGTST
jgi:hypothetical protein